MATIRASLATDGIVAATRRPSEMTAKDFLIWAVDRVGAWQERAAERRQLLALDDRMLVDIGIDRATAIDEAQKPFWRA